MSWCEKPPGTYENATEDNPHRFGVNVSHHGGMWETDCDGMPSLMGCGAYVEHSRPYTKASRKRKPSGWLICYGRDEDGTDDKRIVLAFCPKCASVVEGQEARQ